MTFKLLTWWVLNPWTHRSSSSYKMLSELEHIVMTLVMFCSIIENYKACEECWVVYCSFVRDAAICGGAKCRMWHPLIMHFGHQCMAWYATTIACNHSIWILILPVAILNILEYIVVKLWKLLILFLSHQINWLIHSIEQKRLYHPWTFLSVYLVRLVTYAFCK